MNDKRNVTIGCLGHSEHGKTSLMVAMAMRAKALGGKVQWMSDVGIMGHSSDIEKPTINDMIEISERSLEARK